MVCHSGMSLSSGHYFSYVRVPPTSSAAQTVASTTPDDTDSVDGADADPLWLICNDDDITLLRENEVKQKLSVGGSCSTPYMLFYCRKSA